MFRTQNGIGIFVCAFGLLLAGCVSRSGVLADGASPSPGNSFVYGRLTIDRSNFFNNQLALWLQNVNNHHNVYIFFDRNQPVQAVQVKPGRYRVAGFVALNRAHGIEGRRDFGSTGNSVSVFQPFDVGPNQGVYLSDFVGEATFDGMIYSWKLDSATNNFVPTTKELRQGHPGLSAFPLTSVLEEQTDSHMIQRQVQKDWK